MLAVLSVCVMVTAISPVASAAPSSGAGGQHHQLTEEQKEKIKQFIQQHKQELAPLLKQLKEARQQHDEKKIHEIRREILKMVMQHRNAGGAGSKTSGKTAA
jgi:predicted glycosyl hydrolase (DUF1957 family)